MLLTGAEVSILLFGEAGSHSSMPETAKVLKLFFNEAEAPWSFHLPFSQLFSSSVTIALLPSSLEIWKYVLLKKCVLAVSFVLCSLRHIFGLVSIGTDF